MHELNYWFSQQEEDLALKSLLVRPTRKPKSCLKGCAPSDFLVKLLSPYGQVWFHQATFCPPLKTIFREVHGWSLWAKPMSLCWTAVCPLLCKFIERNKNQSNSMYVFTRLVNKSDFGKRKEATNCKMLVVHTIIPVSRWTSKIRVGNHVWILSLYESHRWGTVALALMCLRR